LSAPHLALSIRQPWAWLILHAGKDYENRTWTTKVRGRIYVHAGLKWGREEKETRADVQEDFGIAIPERPPLGALVGTVRIVDCVADAPSGNPWFMGPFAFLLADPQPFAEPVPCPGQLGFFEPPGSVLECCPAERIIGWGASGLHDA
jgi:hypothetical protein